MLPEVRISIQDGGLGLLPASAAAVAHAAVGVSSAGTVGQIVSIADAGVISSRFGTGPLANALADALVGGARLIHAVRAEGDIPGVVREVQKDKTGTGDLSVSGEPLDAYRLVVEILTTGNLNVATFRFSLDAGYSFSGPITAPTGGAYTVTGTGLVLTFTAGATEPQTSFVEGDKYSCGTTAPKASVEKIVSAIDVLLSSNLDYEFIHVVGESDAGSWASLATKVAEAESRYRYIHILAEAAAPTDGQTTSAWITALSVAASAFASARVSVCAAIAEVTDFLTGRRAKRNAAGIYAGRVSGIPVQRSPGRVMDGPLPGVAALLPADLAEGDIAVLDDARFVTFRQYVGLSGFYVSNGRMMGDAASDFRHVELRRVMDKACRLVRAAALQFEQAEASEEGLKALEANLTSPLEAMQGAGEITSGQAVIPAGQDIIATSTLRAKVRIIPIGIMREIEVEIGFANPVSGGGQE